MTNARTARGRRQTPTKARDTRQPRKLSTERATGADLMSIVHNSIQQALSSDAAKIALRSYCDGAGLDGEWGLRLKNLQLGELWLMPIRNEEPEEPAPQPPQPDTNHKPDLTVVRKRAAKAPAPPTKTSSGGSS